MKKTVFIAVALMALVFTSCKDNAADKVNDENVAAAAERDANSGKFPVMAFEETSFDFGTIEQGVAQQHVFKFTNTGESDLVIVDAKEAVVVRYPNGLKLLPLELMVKFW